MKNYKEFINEQNFSDFSDKEILDYMHNDLNIKSSSFSTFAHKNNAEIEQQAKKAIDKLDSLFGPDRMKKIASNISSKTYYNYNHADGIKDIIFNHYDSNFILSGMNINEDPDRFIKYAYGWHTKKYTTMAILQKFNTVQDFVIWSLNGLQQSLENLYSDIICYKTLILDPESKDKKYVSYPSEQTYIERKFLYSKPYNNKYIVINEILDEKENSILKDDDYLKFFYKVCDKNLNIAKKVDWLNILPGDKESNKNLISSKLSLSKFNI